MTLLQLKYVITVASSQTISKAAEELYITQPSLTASIKELENEIGITIFQRTNKGIVLTMEGEEFLSYARQIIGQFQLLEERYLGTAPVRHQFCVSTQHYSFAVEAFVALLKEYGGDTYDFRIRETQTYEIIEDVAKLKSEIGILYLNQFNETVLCASSLEITISISNGFLSQSPMYLSISTIHWPRKKQSHSRIWRPIRVCLTSREIIMRSIFQKKF